MKDPQRLETVCRPHVVPNLKNIGASAFYNCYAMTNLDFSGTKLETIGANAFSGSGIEKVIYEDSTTSIEFGANIFNGCTNLADVKLPDGLIAEGASTFTNCTSLTSIELPSAAAAASRMSRLMFGAPMQLSGQSRTRLLMAFPTICLLL